jgi:hypothetical protein
VEADGEMAADIVLRARFLVTNKSSKAARVWTVKLEVIPSSEAIANRFKHYPSANSGDVILPSQTGVKTIEFGFRIYRDERFPLPFAVRGLVTSAIRFHTVSEDGIGPPQSRTISEGAETETLSSSIGITLRNKLSWQ